MIEEEDEAFCNDCRSCVDFALPVVNVDGCREYFVKRLAEDVEGLRARQDKLVADGKLEAARQMYFFTVGIEYALEIAKYMKGVK
jgi:hypothetical protein